VRGLFKCDSKDGLFAAAARSVSVLCILATAAKHRAQSAVKLLAGTIMYVEIKKKAFL
jgi:hypothetical protein